jgi:hypothetical protein
MALYNITTVLDRAAMRKTTSILTSSGDGYYVYPGLRGNIKLFKVSGHTITGKCSTAKSEHDRDIYDLEEIKQVIYNAMMTGISPKDHIDKSDVEYMVYHNVAIQRLCEDIMNWSWNNRNY